jgi:hypothetical protein
MTVGERKKVIADNRSIPPPIPRTPERIAVKNEAKPRIINKTYSPEL